MASLRWSCPKWGHIHGVFSHPSFLRDSPHLIVDIRRNCRTGTKQHRRSPALIMLRKRNCQVNPFPLPLPLPSSSITSSLGEEVHAEEKQAKEVHTEEEVHAEELTDRRHENKELEEMVRVLQETVDQLGGMVKMLQETEVQPSSSSNVDLTNKKRKSELSVGDIVFSTPVDDLILMGPTQRKASGVLTTIDDFVTSTDFLYGKSKLL